MSRIFYFLLTNLAIIVVLNFALMILMPLLGAQGIQTAEGDIDYYGLLVFAAIIGMAGSFISLAMSKWIAKRMTGAKVITDPRGGAEQWLMQRVSVHSQAANIGMPEVAIYDSEVPNAFATGARRNSSLVAVSTGLMRGMTQDEVDAVLAHEVSHIANGDMVTLALIQGVVNTFVIFLARIVGHLVDQAVFRSEGQRGHGPGYFIVTIVAQIIFGIIASVVVAYFSRKREFRADAGAARLTGANKMIAALERLKTGHQEALPDQMEAFGISGGVRGGLMTLFASHPPLDERIEALRQMGG
jgi:heat shock protein HtpX